MRTTGPQERLAEAEDRVLCSLHVDLHHHTGRFRDQGGDGIQRSEVDFLASVEPDPRRVERGERRAPLRTARASSCSDPRCPPDGPRRDHRPRSGARSPPTRRPRPGRSRTRGRRRAARPLTSSRRAGAGSRPARSDGTPFETSRRNALGTRSARKRLAKRFRLNQLCRRAWRSTPPSCQTACAAVSPGSTS